MILHPRGDRHHETPRKRDGGASSSGRSTPRDAEREMEELHPQGDRHRETPRDSSQSGRGKRERRGQISVGFLTRRRGGVEDSEIDEERTSSIITEVSGRARETRRHHRQLIMEASRRARDTRRHHRRLTTEPSRRRRGEIDFVERRRRLKAESSREIQKKRLCFVREREKGTPTHIMPTCVPLASLPLKPN